MPTNKNTLHSIISKKLSNSMNFIGGVLPPFDTNKIESKLESVEEKIKVYAVDLDTDTIKKFLNHPQIDSLLISYLQYLLIPNFYRDNYKKRITRDKVVNKLINIIETHFKNIADDKSVSAIKNILDYMFDFYNDVFADDEVEDVIATDYAMIYENRINTKIRKLLKEIDFFVNQDVFLPEENFEQTKNQYHSVLKQLNQNGFIYLLGEYKFNDFYIPPILMKNRGDNVFFESYAFYRNDFSIDLHRKNWIKIFDWDNIIYIVGGAGFGKSLFLKNLINNFNKLNINKINNYLVIYCDLKTYYTNGNTNKKTILDFLEESMINLTGVEDISKNMVEYYLKMGRCLVLLDALDEVPKAKRNELHKKTVAFFLNCNPYNKVCITSRSRGFIPQEKIDVMEILPLTFKDIEDYIDKMIDLKKFKKGNKSKFLEQAKVLVEKNFLNNFLVLSLLVNIYKAEKALPENKIDLYKKCFEYIAKKREEENQNTGYNWDNILPIMKDSTFISLSVLAAPNNKDIDRSDIEERLLKQYKTKYSEEAKTEMAIKEFLEFCSNRTELFVPAAVDDKFKFFHRSFFEYFYSRYIYQQSNIIDMYNLMSRFDVDSEVFELTVALVKEDNEEKYQELIEYIFDTVEKEFKMPRISFNGFKILTMAMQVVDDAYYIAKYFDLILEYKDILYDEILHLNQKVISICINKVISKDEKKREAFVTAYGNRCLCYFLELISNSNNSDLSTVDFLKLSFNSEHRLKYVFHDNKRLPFFVRVFFENDLLYSLIKNSLSMSFKDVINYINMPISYKNKKQLKKGYEMCKRLDENEIEQLIKCLT